MQLIIRDLIYRSPLKVVEAFLQLPVKPHTQIKIAFTLPEKIRPVKTSFHVAAVLLPGMVGFRS